MQPRDYYEKNARRHDESVKNRPHPGASHRGNARDSGYRTDGDVALDFLRSYGPFERFLDIGCSDLGFLNQVRPIASNLWGVDIAEFVSWKDSLGIVTQVCDLDKTGLPFPDNYFDAVSMLMVLEHVFDPFGAIKEVARVLKPGGLFVVDVPNIGYVKHRVGLVMGELPITSSKHSWEDKSWDGYHLHYFTLERLKWLLATEGNLRSLRSGGSGRWSRLRSIWPSLLTGDLVVLAQK